MSPRRDKDTKNASVIAGLRLEPELALKLTDYALREREAGERQADVASAARRCLRIGLGQTPEQALAAEAYTCPDGIVRGLRVDVALGTAVRALARKYSLVNSGAARHLLRLAFGISVQESLRRERVFAEIAAQRRAIYEGSV